MRVVVDTNVFVSAIFSPTGSPAQVLDFIASRRGTLLVSHEIVQEYREVLRRKKLALDQKAVEDLLQFVEAYAEKIPDTYPKVSLPDPKDLPFLACALEGEADFLITGNEKHFPPSVCRPVRSVSPTEFLKIVSKRRP